jgi:ABC-type multidrug transport system ATPase subunit
VSATDVSLELPAGKTLVVFGPNGVRKTTLLRMLATLLRPQAGAVLVLGRALPTRTMGARRSACSAMSRCCTAS